MFKSFDNLVFVLIYCIWNFIWVFKEYKKILKSIFDMLGV